MFIWENKFWPQRTQRPQRYKIINCVNLCKSVSKILCQTLKEELKMTYNKSRKNAASALILAVVLTSLLAIIGVMFVMIARVDKMATSAISENKELNFAVETVVAKISQELVLDVPHTDSNGLKLSEYYDYPDANNSWLASLEPYKDGTDYKWRQISDVYEKLPDLELTAGIIPDYQEPSYVGDSNSTKDYPADADGDGVADSKWVKLDDITSNKGKPIYAAIRIVDNGGMINVNTAYKFDPTETDPNLIDGSSQTQINLLALSERGSTSNPLGKLDDARFGSEIHVLDNYIKDVVWRYNEPNGLYTPFDISDELEIRNRFTLNRTDVDSRLENLWADAFKGANYLSTPVDKLADLSSKWGKEVYYDLSEPNAYSYRHIGTIYNMDRIIDPDCNKMTNINKADAYSIYRAVKSALDPNFPDANDVTAQIAVNLVDFRDGATDPNVTTLVVNGTTYYGFERPCIYISELAHRFKKDVVDPNIVYKSYAVELYKPYSGDNDPDPNWQIVIKNPDKTASINWSGTGQYHVIRWQNTNAQLDVNGTPQEKGNPTSEIIFDVNSTISLTRKVGSVDVVVDSKVVPGGWLIADGNSHSIQRDIQPHKCIRRLWGSDVNSPTLGYSNAYSVGDSIYIQAHPANEDFTNIGEIGMLFRKSAYSQGPHPIEPNDTEATARLNLADPNFQQLFKYLTVWPPSEYVSDPNETRIKGRININTAPWYVLAQLPWVSDPTLALDDPDRYKLARAIVAYRDKDSVSGGPNYSGRSGEPGFRSIGELNRIVSGSDDYRVDYYARDSVDLAGFPDLTPGGLIGDEAPDDFEERDVIFARISNLVTVRSDVFTAYILVRIGTDGPQKRVMAILDRSNVYSGDGKVRIVALHPVPDPR